MQAKYIFITGGVVSSLGKGIAAAALGALLQARGYKVRIRKLDPYLNIDPGTMSPYQHGEVFVTDDGAETDLDLGHYERFTGVCAYMSDNITAGRIYSRVLKKERRGDYLGATIQVIPHVTNEIKEFIATDNNREDFIICEIGGTIGDIEGLPFLEAIRQFGNEVGTSRAMFIHVTLLPYIPTAGELKTKPTQHSVKELLSVGIQPSLLLCRSDRKIPKEERRKIALFCNVDEKNVIAALDVNSIYETPISYSKEGLDTQVLKYFNIEPKSLDITNWQKIINNLNNLKDKVNIAVVGKYVGLPDSYKSISEALTHGGIANNCKVNIKFIDAEELENISEEKVKEKLSNFDGILVPGGFGDRGTEGKIATVKFARENNIPYLGICLGMQMAVIEFARNVANIKGANSTEFDNCTEPVIALMTEWTTAKGAREQRSKDMDKGGTMRLGAYKSKLKEGSKIYNIYGTQKIISERHRHRYEVNINYRDILEKAGLVFSAMSPDGILPEAIEIPNHSWFVGVQYHPEFKSRPFEPHPLFVSFIKSMLKN